MQYLILTIGFIFISLFVYHVPIGKNISIRRNWMFLFSIYLLISGLASFSLYLGVENLCTPILYYSASFSGVIILLNRAEITQQKRLILIIIGICTSQLLILFAIIGFSDYFENITLLLYLLIIVIKPLIGIIVFGLAILLTFKKFFPAAVFILTPVFSILLLITQKLTQNISSTINDFYIASITGLIFAIWVIFQIKTMQSKDTK